MCFLLYAAAAYALAPQQHSAALEAAERAVDAAVASTSQPIEALPPAERESVAIARRLRRRLGACRFPATFSARRFAHGRWWIPTDRSSTALPTFQYQIGSSDTR